ncbi:MAG TPA: SMC family ATPase [Acidimicrobiales bacterium]|nr:SMC family ATPase [Acidimicrobiales bacterium]
MRLTRLYLRNYRVYENELDLVIPPGLVGIYGRNGAGKSTLLEAISWTLYGRARTAKDEIRTSGVNAECVTEVEFEHEGHLYLVRRTISGASDTVRAQGFADGAQVCEGVRDSARYVHSVLGMDDVAFRASVFAEQKQLAAFSATGPAERRRLVLGLLGVTPLDTARDQARRDARAGREQLDRLRTLLPDRSALAEAVTASRAAARSAMGAATEAATEAARAAARLDEARSHLARVAVVAGEYEALVREGRSIREQRDGSARRQEKLSAELAALDVAAGQLEVLTARAEGVEALERRLALAEAVRSAARVLAAAPVGDPPPRPDDDAMAQAEGRAAAAGQALAAVDGRLQAARQAHRQAQDVFKRSAGLSGEADCPLCGQALGEAFEEVRRHRAEEESQAAVAVAELERLLGEATTEAERARRQADDARRAHSRSAEAWAAHEKAAARRRDAEDALREATEALVAAGGQTADDPDELRADLVGRRRAAADASELKGRLARRSQAAKDLEAETATVADLDDRLTTLRDKVKALGFSPSALEDARAASEAVEREVAALTRTEADARAAAAAAEAAAQRDAGRLEEAEGAHARLAETEEEVRHLGRVAELLNTFRNSVVATVGPRLSSHAADLFAELTDHEYDRLEVDPETYEIKIRDGGVAYGMNRFSGSETDLANLALRVAISEHVRFQSGGAVGLLVLDEVFGPLDDDRKERMLLALERLRGRFRQVLVVTHATDIKEQLPGAIEVVKLPGRRATARLLNG